MPNLTQQLATRLDGVTSLAPDRVFECARAAADGLRAENLVLREAGVHEEKDLIVFDIVSHYAKIHGNASQGRVYVDVGADESEQASPPDGCTGVSAGLAEPKYIRASVMLIPISPKRMLGFKLYHRFLTTLANHLVAADTHERARFTVGQHTSAAARRPE